MTAGWRERITMFLVSMKLTGSIVILFELYSMHLSIDCTTILQQVSFEVKSSNSTLILVSAHKERLARETTLI